MSRRRTPTADREPDPARSYERAKPEKEAGLGRLDAVQATPTNRPDRAGEAAGNVLTPRQRDANEVEDQRQAIDLTKKTPATARRRPKRTGAPTSRTQ